jgi:hypothetical protein
MNHAEAAGPGHPGADADDDSVERLERWQQFGATWTLVSQHAGTVTISLCRCDGGEEVGQIVSDDAHLLAWLGGRTSSDDPGPRTGPDSPSA